MKKFGDRLFVVAYVKYAVVALAGAAISTVVGVPGNTAATLAFGAVVGFPVAYNLAIHASGERAIESRP
jgi:hypothetical protein